MKDYDLSLEARLRELELENVRMKTELEGLKTSYEKISDDFNTYEERIRTGKNKVLWIIGGGVLSAFVTWILKGGLSNVVN